MSQMARCHFARHQTTPEHTFYVPTIIRAYIDLSMQLKITQILDIYDMIFCYILFLLPIFCQFSLTSILQFFLVLGHAFSCTFLQLSSFVFCRQSLQFFSLDQYFQFSLQDLLSFLVSCSLQSGAIVIQGRQTCARVQVRSSTSSMGGMVFSIGILLLDYFFVVMQSVQFIFGVVGEYLVGSRAFALGWAILRQH